MKNSRLPDKNHADSRRGLAFSRAELFVALFTTAYMLVALVCALVLGNPEFVYYIGVMVLLISGVMLLHFRVQLPAAALWGLSVWGLAHMAGGLMTIPDSWPTSGTGLVLYNLWLIPGYLKYDQFVHAYGYGIVTWVCWLALSRTFPKQQRSGWTSGGLLILCVAAGMGFGALNEVVEFFATILMTETNVGGYENTGWDLVANMAGCLIAAVFIAWSDRGSRAIAE